MKIRTSSGTLYLLDGPAEDLRITRLTEEPISNAPSVTMQASPLLSHRPPTIGQRWGFVTVEHGLFTTSPITAIEP